jgi:uncharacterized protein (TIGR00730 family)
MAPGLDYSAVDHNNSISIIKTVCVYCSASNHLNDVYKNAAHELGSILAQSGFDIVFGGGKSGLMGIVADAAIMNGGSVLGYIPTMLNATEGSHTGIKELYVVETMHSRKQNIFDNADAFVVLPGGFGTMDELFEIATWKMIGIHNKSIFLININNYWDDIIRHINRMIFEHFAKPIHINLIEVLNTVDQVVPRIQEIEKYIYFDNDIT